MKLLLVVAGLCLTIGWTACRKVPAEVTIETEQAPVEEVWTPLTGEWLGVEGGEVTEADGVLKLEAGWSLTGACWQGEVPSIPFVFEAEARRVVGSDFFFSLTFPGRTETEAATLVVGGWGGGLVGLSSIDGLDASENETTEFLKLEDERWYAIRLQVTAETVAAWIDDEPVFDVSIEGRELSLRPGPIEVCAPFGVATWETLGEARNMRWKPLTEPLQP